MNIFEFTLPFSANFGQSTRCLFHHYCRSNLWIQLAQVACWTNTIILGSSKFYLFHYQIQNSKPALSKFNGNRNWTVLKLKPCIHCTNMPMTLTQKMDRVIVTHCIHIDRLTNLRITLHFSKLFPLDVCSNVQDLYRKSLRAGRWMFPFSFCMRISARGIRKYAVCWCFAFFLSI